MGVEVWVLRGDGMSRVGWPGADWALVALGRTGNSSFQESRQLSSFCALKPAGRPTEGPRPIRPLGASRFSGGCSLHCRRSTTSNGKLSADESERLLIEFRYSPDGQRAG